MKGIVVVAAAVVVAVVIFRSIAVQNLFLQKLINEIIGALLSPICASNEIISKFKLRWQRLKMFGLKKLQMPRLNSIEKFQHKILLYTRI